MFLSLLVATFLCALVVSLVVGRMFAGPIRSIVQRIIADDISVAWQRYMHFAIVVVGVSAGVRVYELERYITPQCCDKSAQILTLSTDRWVLEIYRTIIETLQGIAWLLLVFFVFTLIAYVIVRKNELKGRPSP
jgi:hypothetical protein